MELCSFEYVQRQKMLIKLRMSPNAMCQSYVGVPAEVLEQGLRTTG